MKSAVINASPLIVLGRAGYLDLLIKLFSSVVAPRGVADEIRAGPRDEVLFALLTGTKWLSIVEITPEISRLAGARLGRGETEVLEFANINRV